MIKRVKDAISPKKFANGTHSKIERFKNMSMKGIKLAAPPRPPAFEINPIRKSTITPISSRKVGGKTSFFIMKTSESIAV